MPIVHGLGPLGTWLFVYPRGVAELARWELEYPLKDRERSILLLGQLDRDIRRGCSSCGIVAWAIAFEFGHGSVYIVSKSLGTVTEFRCLL